MLLLLRHGDDVGPNCWLETNEMMAGNNATAPENNNTARGGRLLG